MIKQLTLEEIKKALREYPSAEPDGDEIVYYLHVTYAGKIVSDTRIANETFTASRDMDEYFDGVPEEYSEDWGASCAWVEDQGDGRFADVCDDLRIDVNEWLSKHEKVFCPYGWDGDEVEDGGTVYRGLNALRTQLEEELPYDGRMWDFREIVIGVDEGDNGATPGKWSDDGRVCVTDCSVALDHEQSPRGGLLYIRFEKEEHFILDDDGEIIEDESRTIKFY